MKKAAAALILIFIISACSETVDSVFRPDFGIQSSDLQSSKNYIPPSATARARAEKTAKKTGAPKLAPARKVDPYIPSLGQPVGNSSLNGKSPLSLPTALMTPSKVDTYYEQQLKLHQGNTKPNSASPRSPPKERSWFGLIFGSDAPTPQANPPSNCYIGKLTTEGVSCQAMRTLKGRLLTLGGPLRGFGPGDSVCVCGPLAETSFCQQGTTIYVAQIDTRCDKP